MNLLRKNIHMDAVKSQAVSQITLEDDVNLPDSRPDIEKIILEDGTGKIEEIKTSGDHVTVRGRLFVNVLYVTDDRENVVARMEGVIPFEEQVFMEGIQSNQHVEGTMEVEDLSIGLINSRKISVRAILTLHTWLNELTDEEVGVELSGDEPVEYRKKQLDFTQIAVCKKDIYRIRQEMELPSNLPNIFQMIWESVKISGLEFKALDEKIAINGELQVFFLYEGESEERPIRFYEGTIPFNGFLDEKSSREMMITDIDSIIGSLEVEVKPDFDGEERVIALEAVMDLDIRLYEEEKMEILSDVYGVTKEVTAVTRQGTMKQLLFKNNAKTRVDGKLKIRGGNKNILQMLHGSATPVVEEVNILEDSIEINGFLQTKCLYVTSDDMTPYDAVAGKVPFQYVMDAKGINNTHQVRTKVMIEQFSAGMADGENVEIKAVLFVQALVFENRKQEFVTDVQVEELDMKKIKNLPQMVVHVAKEGDSLWQIGKKYYVPVAEIKEINEITQDECKKGQKILVVR